MLKDSSLNLKQSILTVFAITKYRVKKYQDSERYYLILQKNNMPLDSLIFAVVKTRLSKFNESNKIVSHVLKNKATDLNANLVYGLCLTIQRKYEKANEYFEKAEKIDPKDNLVYFRWASFYAAQGQEKETYENMKKAFELGFKDLWRFEDEEFVSIRDKNDFRELIKKYFPESK